VLGLKLEIIKVLCKHKGVRYQDDDKPQDTIVVAVTQIVYPLTNTYQCSYLGMHVNTAEFHMSH